VRKTKLMITGSGGFIFANFIRQVFFAKLPYLISSIDRVRDSHIVHNIYVNADHSFYIADIRDPHIMHVVFQKERPDVVIHGAVENDSNNTTMITSNVVGTQNIIDECIKTGSKLIYMSTDEVYGGMQKETEPPWNEGVPLNPLNTFAATKASGELLVKAARGLSFNIVRASNNYGPWQMSSKFIPGIIRKVLGNEDISIFGDGRQLRDWIHVFDTCSALFKIIDKGVDGEVYNISARQEFMNLEVAQIVCNTLGAGHNLIKHVEDRPEYSFRRAISNDKIKSLGWVPEYKFRDGIQQTCQWYVNNKFVLKM
jgi:dTDP-glucose 4,6-dehydratase